MDEQCPIGKRGGETLTLLANHMAALMHPEKLANDCEVLKFKISCGRQPSDAETTAKLMRLNLTQALAGNIHSAYYKFNKERLD